MIYIANHFFLALLVELPIMRSTYKILRMRSVRLFVILHLVLYCLGAIMIDYMGGSTYSLISGGRLFPSEINAETIGPVVTIYSLLIVLAISVNEAIIALCGHLDHERDVPIAPPVIILPLFSYLTLTILYARRSALEVHEAILPVLILACSLMTLAICAGLIVVARQEAEAARKAADAATMARQERHVRGEIEASIRRTTEMSRLRHDLANQVEVVERLATQGRYADADRYLARLQLEAQALIGEEG